MISKMSLKVALISGYVTYMLGETRLAELHIVTDTYPKIVELLHTGIPSPSSGLSVAITGLGPDTDTVAAWKGNEVD